MTYDPFRFTGKGQVPEQVTDTDLTHNSPHHTIGKGATQAAAGNHKHGADDITSGTLDSDRLPFKLGRAGPYSISADSSTANLTIPHGLGKVPTVCFVSVDGDGGDCTAFASVVSFDNTNLICHMRNIGGIESAVYLNWIVL